MTNSRLIDKTINGVLKKIKDTLKSSWDSHYYSDIYQKVKLEKQRYPDRDEWQINRTINAEYTTLFNQVWQSKIKPIFTRQFDKISPNPSEILKEFLTIHPWLATQIKDRKIESKAEYEVEAETETDIDTERDVAKEAEGEDIEKYSGYEPLPVLLLMSIFKSCIEKITLDKYKPWKEYAFDSKEGLFTLTLPQEQWIRGQIQGYPMQDTVSLYRDHHCLQSITLEKYQLPPTRLDLFRLLTKSYPKQMSSRLSSDEVPCVEIMPLHIDDLQHLSGSQWDHVKILLVNVRTESEPQWVALKRGASGDSWILYCPADDGLKQGYSPASASTVEPFPYDEEKKPKAPPRLLPLTNKEITETINSIKPKVTLEIQDTVYVDHGESLKLNNFEFPLTADELWSITLFGRALPAILQNKDPKDFRTRVPLPILYQEVLEKCVTHKLDDKKRDSDTYDYSYYHVKNAFLRRLVFTKEYYNRSSFSDLITNNYYGGYNKELIWSSSKELDDFNELLVVENILTAFDQGTFTISGKNLTELTLKAPITEEDLLGALYVIYHNNISFISYPVPSSNKSSHTPGFLKKLIEYDTHILTVIPVIEKEQNMQQHAYHIHCAARNRFLHAVFPSYLKEAEKEMELRRKVWPKTVKTMLDFFEANKDKINAEFVKEVRQFRQKWRMNYCNQEASSEIKTTQGDLLWPFLQIAEMGTAGLDAFFDYLENTHVAKWVPTYKDNPPNACALFDLDGSLTDSPAAYIKYLTQKIKNFDEQKTGCAPLFSQLVLILPSIDEEKNWFRSFIDLLNVLNERALNNPDDTHELVLHGLDLHAGANDFIKCLEELVEKEYRILIRIPAWDKAAPLTTVECNLKARYRHIQNLVLGNNRTLHEAALKSNTETFNKFYEQKWSITGLQSVSENISLLSSKKGRWDGDDFSYPLTLQPPGIQQQQQLQQGVQVNVVQEEVQQQEQVTDKIDTYKGNEFDLIDRYNIHEKMSEVWDKIPADIKDRSGWDKKDLKSLFSIWVGSQSDGKEIIGKMTPSAVQELMKYAPHHQMGLVKDDLPPGFYFECSRWNKERFILCFRERRRSEDLLKRALNPKKTNHFTVNPHPPRAVSVFPGDFRQFCTFNNNVDEQQLLWRYLATEDLDLERIKNAKDAYQKKSSDQSDLSDDEASVIMQRFDAHHEIKRPGDYGACLAVLKNWAKENGISDELQNLFFSSESKEALSRDNLKSFGQLFNHFDYRFTGTSSLLKMADALLSHFGKDYFSVWKKRILAPSKNWSECIDKEEVDAVSISIVALKKMGPNFIKLWWKLVDCHGEKTGHFRYAHLWVAYQSFLDILLKYSLTLDHDKLLNYLEGTDTRNFNAIVFFDRLSSVLKQIATQNNCTTIQQKILDNVNTIDWSHNGLYYAVCYESYPYWDESLKLHEFSQTIEKKYSWSSDDNITYHTQWKHNANLTDPITHALRFISQRAQFTPEQFEIVKKHSKSFSSLHPLLLRLFIASITLGVDHLRDINNIRFQFQGLTVEDKEEGPEGTYETEEKKPEKKANFGAFCQWANKSIRLKGQLQPFTLHLHFNHLPVLYKVLNELDLLQAAMDYKPPLEFINAAGRALQYLGEKKFKTLLAQVKTNLNHPLLMYWPWLLTEYQDGTFDFKSLESSILEPCDPQKLSQRMLLLNQLRSIDFSLSTGFPSLEEMSKTFQGLNDAATIEDAIKLRRTATSLWIEKGCIMRNQNAKFELATKLTIKAAQQLINGALKPTYLQKNSALFEKLFNHLAFEADEKPKAIEEQFKKLLTILAQLDNKSYYNEVGQLLGLLIEKAESIKGKQFFYSVPLLTAWINILSDPKKRQEKHFPTDLLDVILTNCLQDENSELVNPDRNQLSASVSDNTLALQNKVYDILSLALPNVYKRLLVSLAVKNQQKPYIEELSKRYLIELYTNGANEDWLKSFTQLIAFLTDPKQSFFVFNEPNFQKALSQLSYNCLSEQDGPLLNRAWQNTQNKRIQLILQGNIKYDDFQFLFAGNKYEALIQIILIQAMGNEMPDKQKMDIAYKKLLEHDWDELKKLAEYFATGPAISIKQLNKILRDPSYTKKTDQFIHQFETIEQGLTEEDDEKKSGQDPKRKYSIDPQDRKDLIRIIQGIKQKGKGFIEVKTQTELLASLFYANNYSQIMRLETLPINRLQDLMLKENAELKRSSNDLYSSARLLACMREILFRKTGMWANHTQMLDLLYAALHNCSLLHQVRTGQGKSIITMMRAAYLALQGSIVDVFTSKESLSKRDHDDFALVLDAMKVPHAYITSQSEFEEYQNQISEKTYIGAVNFSTLGNFSLFYSSQIWNQKNLFELTKAKRVAFLDECDYLLQDEQTQFNFADEGSESAYNFDEWAYRIVYEFYLQLVDDAKKQGKFVSSISRNNDLKRLCDLLQEKMGTAPAQSRFFPAYIIPAFNGDVKAVKKRDLKLLQLLVAAHTAHHLNEHKDFTIWPEERKLADGQTIKTRVAKVVIDNQIQLGSTYSDLVQQFLHVRLNHEATRCKQLPNFFVEPVSQIALSSNAKFIIKNYYGKIEGCSGTAGNKADLKLYRDEYGIDHVIKLPTHEEIQTEFLPTIYSEDEDKQIDEIIAVIKVRGPLQPILITCQDDIAVKRISAKVMAKMQSELDRYQWIIDTNDQGRSEKEILPLAGAIGALTFSARLKRGTDIKPKSEQGLMVLRTYPAPPRLTKQEKGRQGRYGKKGQCQDIINYKEVLDKHAYYEKHENLRLTNIYSDEEIHLNEKMEKHKKKGSKKWEHLSDDTIKKQYLITRSVTLLQYELDQQKEKFLREKEYLIAALSDNVMKGLQAQLLAKSRSSVTSENTLPEDWLDCRRQIEALWNTRLTDKKNDGLEIYKDFEEKAEKEWHLLCDKYSSVLSYKAFSRAAVKLKKPHDEKKESKSQQGASPISTPSVDTDGKLTALINIYQAWFNKTNQIYFSNKKCNEELIKAFYGDKQDIFLRNFYEALTKNITNPVFCDTFQFIMTQPGFYTINCAAWAQSLEKFQSDQSLRILASVFKSVVPFNEAVVEESTYTVDEINKRSSLLAFITNMIVDVRVDAKKIENFIQNFCAIVYDKQGKSFSQTRLNDLKELFAPENAKITHLFMGNTSKDDIKYFIDCWEQERHHESKGSVTKRTQLIKYLNKNSGFLQKSPTTMRPLFELVLGDPAVRLTFDNALPALDKLSKWDPDYFVQEQFLYFLTRRMPIGISPLEKFENWLVQQAKPTLQNLKFYSPLFDIPPFISLDYIVDNLASLAAPERKTISRSGEVFNDFLFKMNLIKKGDHYPLSEPARTEIDTWAVIFHKLSPEQNILFFEMAIPWLNKWYKNIVSQTEKHKMPTVLNQLKVFSELVKKEERTLTEEDLKYLWDCCQEQLSEVELQEKLELVKKIKLYADTPAGAFIKKQIYGETRGRNCNRQLQFLVVLNLQHAEVSQNIEIIPPVFDTFMKNETLKPAYLLEMLSVAQDASMLNKTRNYSEFFADSLKRRKLLQYLHHGLLDFIPDQKDFANRCYREYGRIAFDLTKPAEDLEELKEGQRATLQERCRQVLNFTKEWAHIIKCPHEIETKRTDEKVVSPIAKRRKEDHFKFFEKQQAVYGRFWRSRLRKRQANTLFSELKTNSESKTATRMDYYKNNIDTILKAQKDLLQGDKNSTRNSKGYSRLYDISMQMLMKLMSSWLGEKMSQDERTALNEILRNQLTFNVLHLQARLGEDKKPNNSLQTNLSKWITQNTIQQADGNDILQSDLRNLAVLLKDARKTVPAHLVNLIDNIAYFVNIGNESAYDELYSQELVY